MERQEKAPKKTIDFGSFASCRFPAYNCKAGTAVSIPAGPFLSHERAPPSTHCCTSVGVVTSSYHISCPLSPCVIISSPYLQCFPVYNPGSSLILNAWLPFSFSVIASEV